MKVITGIYIYHIEFINQILNLVALIYYCEDTTPGNKLFAEKSLQVIILFRSLRIGAFLRELNAMRNFERTISILIKSLASLILALNTVYLLYT